jgi:hypothetical protein
MACSTTVISVEAKLYNIGLGWSPEQFWNSTLIELMSAYSALLPDINTYYSDEDLEVFEEIRRKVELENQEAIAKAEQDSKEAECQTPQ